METEALKRKLRCVREDMSCLFTAFGTCSSHGALRGWIDFQMMTLLLVKSTLVSCCVCTREIVCLISRITVSGACVLFKAVREASELISNGIHHSSLGETLQLLS